MIFVDFVAVVLGCRLNFAVDPWSASNFEAPENSMPASIRHVLAFDYQKLKLIELVFTIDVMLFASSVSMTRL